jgi:hypothetical protein
MLANDTECAGMNLQLRRRAFEQPGAGAVRSGRSSRSAIILLAAQLL